MTSSVGYANYTMIKLMIYFNSHIRIDEQITNKFLSEFIYSYRTVVHTDITIPELFLPIYFRNKYLRQPSTDFDF